MLKQLHIKNLVLVDNLQVTFESGFSVLTGETGAGKSTLMQALKLALGSRADSSLIRKGETKGFVICAFDIQGQEEVLHCLNEMGIDHYPNELLIIQREVNENGKNRSFVNQQLVQVATIEKLGSLLVDIASQHAYQRLFSLDEHLSALDAFCKNADLLQAFQEALKQELAIQEKLRALTQLKTTKDEGLKRFQGEVEEIESYHLQDDEEELLFQEYTRLLNHSEQSQKLGEIIEIFEAEKSPLVLLNRQKNLLSDLAEGDASLEMEKNTLCTILVELNELSYLLNQRLAILEVDPKRESFIDQRLKEINQLKKKYGKSIAEILIHKETLLKHIEEMEHIEDHLTALNEELLCSVKQTHEIANKLTLSRKTHLEIFEEAVQQEIRSLNMPKASFHVELTEKPRNLLGDEKIEFKFAPNIGERILSLKESASGGELSRVLLALKTVLAEADRVPTLIFDEIDTNVGGETATIVGRKLAQIGTLHQVLCITHLPQVARFADHHFQIHKEERNERTYTTIACLDKEDRQKELSRMLGGNFIKN